MAIVANIIHIAVLLTCHNRREKTIACLKSLTDAINAFHGNVKPDGFKGTRIQTEIFLTNDGCTDGTAEAIRLLFPDESVLHILSGDGNLYWAGGMRRCWQAAKIRHKEWDYYLLINDDVILQSNVFHELLNAQQFAMEHTGEEGIVSGITCDVNDSSKMTYGGSVWTNRLLSTYRSLSPSGTPQWCDLTNANILLVPTSAVDKIGIFYEGYRHGTADFDYSNTAKKAGIPVLLTSQFCGSCPDDHKDYESEANRIMQMSLQERKEYFDNPIHSSRDYMRFVRRTSPLRLPIVWLGRTLNLYCPKLYYRMSGLRHHKA